VNGLTVNGAKALVIRHLSLALTLVFALLCLSGCHGSRGHDPFEIPEVFDESKEYTITFWAKNDTNKTQVNVYLKAIADFEALYPNIKVEMKRYTDYSRIYNDVITNISTDTTPNVCISYPDHIATYLTGQNIVVPLDRLFDDEKYGFGGSEIRFDGPERDEVIGKFLDECAIGGAHYAIPYMRSSEACYINKTYVEKLGYEIPDILTWDFIWEVSEAAMAKGEDGNYLVNGQNVLIPFIYKSTDNMMIQMLAQKGAGYSTEDGEILIFNETTDSLLLDLAKHCETGCFSTFKISSYPGNFLNAGQCLFAVDSTAGATWMGSGAAHLDIDPESIVPFETVVRPAPQFDASDPKMISQGPSVCIFNKSDPQEVLASWLFAQFLLTDEVQISYAETEGYVPVTSKAQQNGDYLDYLSRSGEDSDLHYYVKIDATWLLLDNIQNTFITPVFNGSASLRDASGQLIENVVKSVRRKENVDASSITAMYDDVRSLYRLDQSGSSLGGATELGALPPASVVLLSTLAVAWVALAAAFIVRFVRTKMKRK